MVACQMIKEHGKAPSLRANWKASQTRTNTCCVFIPHCRQSRMHCFRVKKGGETTIQSFNEIMTVFLGTFPLPSPRNDIKEMLSESLPGRWVVCFLEKTVDFAICLYPEEGWSATDSGISKSRDLRSCELLNLFHFTKNGQVRKF